MKTKIYLYLFEGYSDWEISFLTPEIKKSEAFELIYFSSDGKAVKSMGGLNALPQVSLAEINPDDVNMLILPGGNAWEKEESNPVNALVDEVFRQGNTIAAICAATTYLGQKGFLDQLNHTSNDLNYLKAIAPKYAGEQNYSNSLAITDNNIISAKGIAPIEFAREVFKKLSLHEEHDIDKWFQLFKHGIWSE